MNFSKLYRDNLSEEQKEKLKERLRKNRIKLNEFKNKRCKVCEKLLDYRTKNGLCSKHFSPSFRSLIKQIELK